MAVQPLTIGPLSLMAKSKYDYSLVQYPADLNAEGAKGHSVVFLISDIKSVPVDELGKTAVEYGKKMIQQGVRPKRATWSSSRAEPLRVSA